MLAGYPHHVVQRGHNRQVVFAAQRDYTRYLDTLAEFKAVYGVKVYAYCLMPNHVHDYLLACVRYIELNPVRARMVATPEAYRWSSCRHHLGDEVCVWLDDDPCYLALATDRVQRRKRYRRFLFESIPDGEWSLIRTAVQRGQLTGTSRFVDDVEAILGRRIEHRPLGCPAQNRGK